VLFFLKLGVFKIDTSRLRERGELDGTAIEVNFGDIIKNPEI
jgi:hypothetical protein